MRAALTMVLVSACGVSTSLADGQALVSSWDLAPATEHSRAGLSRALVHARIAGPPTCSTLAERLIGGLVVGGVAGLAAAQRFDDEPVVIAYAAGSAVGVLLATAARERPRPVSVLLGVALGALPLVAVASAERDGPFSAPMLLVGAVTTPLLGAVGQRW